ncbi:MAG: leucine-rich repeat domain-containing protein [bacterium]|nr:leucine-rich repeat domain-containing protein [bacterium]
MKKNGLKKIGAILALSSTALIFAGCGKNNKPIVTTDDDEIKYDSKLKMRYKVFNNEAEIVGIDKQGETLDIPSSISGYTVTRMSCTYTDDELKTVYIPASLTYLTGNGFMNCKNLTTVTFRDGATIADIPSNAFLGTSLESITIPASVKSISYEAFKDIDTLTSISFESGSKLESIGPFAFYSCDGLTTLTLPSSLTTIGGSAFEKCDGLNTITFSSATSLKTIDDYAFSECTKLTNIDFSSNDSLETIGDNAFRGCNNLTTVTFGNSIKRIESKAFYNTQKIKEISLPASLTFVGEEAFVNSGLEKIEIKSGSDTEFGQNAFSQYELDGNNLIPLEKITTLTLNGDLTLDKVFSSYAKQVRSSLAKLHVTGNRIASVAYRNCVNLNDLLIDETVKAIAESAFEGCSSLTQVTLSEGIDSISTNTFKNCINLETINLPSSVNTIRTGAFDGCVKIANLDLSNLVVIGAYAFRNTSISTPSFSDKLQSIGEYAFNGCKNIDEVVINTMNKVASTTIRKYAFAECNAITNIDLSSNVVLEDNAFSSDTNIVSIAVRGEYGLETLFGDSREEAAKKIEHITIMEGTETIEGGAFAGCLLVTSIDIPDTVKTIGYEAFRGCRGITYLDLPDNLQSIGDYAFADCDKLVMTELPQNVTEISEGLFKNCSSIGAFILNDNVTSIGSYAFNGCSNLEISTLNSTIKYIGREAFAGCIKLELTTLPEALVELGAYAFSGCLLVSISATNNSLEYIGDGAFKNCQAITSFEFANDLGSNEGLGEFVLEGCSRIEELKIYGSTSLVSLFGSSANELKSVLSKVTIKEGSTSLADNMFKGFIAISEVIMPEETIITRIGKNAFEECISLTSIDISKVEYIGDYAFTKSGLQSVSIPANGIELGLGVFAYCSSLSEVIFEEAVNADDATITAIPDFTFMETILVDVVLPDSVTIIGHNAFYNIVTLNSFTISDDSLLETIGDDTFNGCSNILEINIPSKVTSIGFAAFCGCMALREVSFAPENKIESISNKLFADCFALTIINLPNTIREIGLSAFENCTCLVEIDLPSNLEVLGGGAFAGCMSLNNVVIPIKIEDIAPATFKDCYMLENVVWNTNIKYIDSEAFYNTPYKTAIPNTIQSIGDSAFASDSNKPVTFEGVTVELGNDANGVSLTIGNDVFLRSGLLSAVLGSKIVSVGTRIFGQSTIQSANLSSLKIAKISDNMFYQCSDFEEVVLGNNNIINAIGEGAFFKTKITDFDFSGILAIGNSAFEEVTSLAIDIVLGVDSNITIGSRAFYGSGITSLVLGSKVINLGNNAFAETDITSADLSALEITAISDSFFANCKSLSTVIISNKIRTIGPSAFLGTALTDISFLDVAENIEQIMDGAFEGCEFMTTAVIPETVSYVGVAAFKDCKALTSVTWSPCCNVMNDSTFNGCTALTTFEVPEHISRIGRYVFTMDQAATITFKSVVPPSVDENFAVGYSNITFIVPAGSLDEYMKNYVFAKVVENITE